MLGAAELHYGAVTTRVLQWLIAEDPPAGAAPFALAAAETLLAAVPPARLGERDWSGERPLWHGGGWMRGLELARWVRQRCGMTAEQAHRLWRLVGHRHPRDAGHRLGRHLLPVPARPVIRHHQHV